MPDHTGKGIDMSDGCPSVEVGITVHNDGRFLDDSLGSALDAARYARSVGVTVSIVVHDDASTDRRTLSILDRVERCNVRVIRSPHGGLSAARNRLVAQTDAEFFIPLDADNRLRPKSIVQLLGAFRSCDGALAAYGDAMRFGSRSGRWTQGPIRLQELPVANQVDACALIHVERVRILGGYDENLHGLEDWDLWLRALQHGYSLAYIPVIVFDYRCRPDSMIHQIGRRPLSQHPIPPGRPFRL
jgi:glycosyltransferase involved in cell wall biosynthesis